MEINRGNFTPHYEEGDELWQMLVVSLENDDAWQTKPGCVDVLYHTVKYAEVAVVTGLGFKLAMTIPGEDVALTFMENKSGALWLAFTTAHQRANAPLAVMAMDVLRLEHHSEE